MKRRIFSLAAGLLLVLSACAPAAPQSSQELIYPTSHPVPHGEPVPPAHA